MSDTRKPLGGKAYGSIPHLPGSRLGPGDHHCHEGQARILTEKARRGDTIIVQEKLDGSCVSVANIAGEIVALGRSGYRAVTSRFYQHILFEQWVAANYERFADLLKPGQRVVGEWLAQAHGTRYDLTRLDHMSEPREPFVAFDLFLEDGKRATLHYLRESVWHYFRMPQALHVGGALPVEDALEHLVHGRYNVGEYGWHGALDPVEGVVYRCERNGRVDFLAKWVRHDKVDGCYLPELNGGEAVWNWRPE